MKIGLIFFMLAAALLLTGATRHHSAARVLCFYASVSAVGLGLAYCLKCPQTLLKRSDGRLSPLSYLLFAPYHAVNRFVLGLFRLTSPDPPYHEIVPGLFLGGRLLSSDAPSVGRDLLFPSGRRKGEALAVVDLAGESAEVRWLRSSSSYCSIPLLDRTAPTVEQLRQGIALIGDHLQRGPVYVHCAFGHSRSVLFVIGYLVARGHCKDLAEALARVKSQRPRAWLNQAQQGCLEEYFHHE